MTDRKISELPAATLPLVGDELTPIVQGGITERVPVSAFGAQLTRYRSGAYYGPLGTRETIDSYPLVADRLDAHPFPILAPIRVSEIGHIVTNSGAAAGQQAKLAIYRSGVNGYPSGAPIYESGVINTPATAPAIFAFSGLDFTLQPGAYWIVWQFNNSALRIRPFERGFGSFLSRGMLTGSTNPSSTSFGLSRTGVAFGATFPPFSDSAADWTTVDGPALSVHYFALRAF